MPVSVGGYNTNFQCNYYLVSSSEATQINVGDLLVMTTNATARVATGAVVFTSSMSTPGVAASVLAANAGSTAATLLVNTSQMVMVWDSPAQVFGITESSSGIIGAGRKQAQRAERPHRSRRVGDDRRDRYRRGAGRCFRSRDDKAGRPAVL